jgi:hypothetical protein
MKKTENQINTMLAGNASVLYQCKTMSNNEPNFFTFM